MRRLAFPDKYEPVCLGFSSSTKTAPHRPFYKMNAPWSPATTTPANCLPSNELFLILLTRHSCCAVIYNRYAANGAVVTKTLQMGAQPPSIGAWLNFNVAVLNANSPAGNGVEPCFADPDGEEGSFVWIDGTTNLTVAITCNTSVAVYANSTTYNLGFCRRAGTIVEYGILQSTTGAGGPYNSITFTSTTLKPGYYSFKASGNLVPAAGGVAITNMVIQETVGASGCYLINHDPLPASIAVTMDNTRINAGRAIMTNFSGPFNAEGGAVAYELPRSERWDDFCIDSGGQYTGSPFTNVSNADLSEDIENSEGISIAAHPDLRSEPVDNMIASATNGTVNSNVMMSPPTFDDISGGVMLVIKTALTNTAARDGLWQLYYATESQTDSQLYPKRHAEYSPLVVLEAEAKFKNFSLITGNPDHFAKGVQALRSLMDKGNRVSDALINSGVGIGVGAPLKFATNLGRALL